MFRRLVVWGIVVVLVLVPVCGFGASCGEVVAFGPSQILATGGFNSGDTILNSVYSLLPLTAIPGFLYYPSAHWVRSHTLHCSKKMPSSIAILRLGHSSYMGEG